MYNLIMIRSQDASMKSRSNSSINVYYHNLKDNQSQQSDNHIYEHESEYISLNQLELQKNEKNIFLIRKF